MSFQEVIETVKVEYDTYITPKDTLVVAVSTGVDSMVLIEALQTVGGKVHVVHFNHHKRAQSEDEAIFIQKYCEKRSLSYTVFDVPTFTQNFQGSARLFRQQKLCAVASQYEQGVIVTAHHVDDQIETYMQRIFSGSSVLNRKTMPIHEKRREQRYFRPLISLQKDCIIQAAKQENIRYFEDESNSESVYLRNKIRNQILPCVASVFPRYRQALKNDFVEIAEMSDFFQKMYEEFAEKNVRVETNEIIINKAALNNEHYYFQSVVFERVLKQMEMSLKRQQYIEMRKALQQAKSQIQLKKDLFFIVDKDFVIIERKQKSKLKVSQKPFFLTDRLQKLPNQMDLCYNKRYTSCQDILEIEAEILPFLRVRYYRTGDEIEIGDYHKRVRRLFIDRKLPREKRDNYPIIEDVRTNKIIWIPTMYKAHSKKAIEKKYRVQIYFNDGGFYA